MKEQVWALWRAASLRYCVVWGDTRGPGRDYAHTHESGRDPHCRDELSCASLARSVAVLTSDSLSSQVHPAASYATTVKKNGGTVTVFNLASSQGDHKANFVFYGPCEETVPALLERAKQMVAGAESLCCKCMSDSLAICVI